MDWGPRRVMRALQLGLREELLQATTPWFCLFCFTCSARCPMELDIPRVMEWVRRVAVREGREPPLKEVAAFHRVFLSEIASRGRIHELALGAKFALRTKHPPPQTRLLARMWLRGKLPLRGHRGGDKRILALIGKEMR